MQADGRAQPTREDKMEFLVALSNASAGHLPLKMLYFYKYLVKHGEEDGFPLIDNDLFFYCEVQKFRVSVYFNKNDIRNSEIRIVYTNIVFLV